MLPNKNKLKIENVNLIGNQKKQIFVFGFFTAFVVLVLLVGAIAPSVQTITRILSEIEEKEQLLDDLENKLETLAALQNEYEEIEGGVRDLKLVFPNNGNFSYLMANLESHSEKMGYDLRSINIADPDESFQFDTEVLEPKGVVIVVEGPIENIIPYLKQIEAMPMYPTINSVSYTTAKTEEGEAIISIKFTIYEINESNFYDEE